jgi:cell wall assembly regulator SMI1
MTKPTGLPSALAQIDAWLAKHRAGFHAGLLPGATDADCDALATVLGAPLPDDLRTLLKWHNGQSADVVGAFERNFCLLSTEQIAASKTDLKAEPRNGWKPGMIPIMDDDQDDYVCLDTTRPGTPVVECWRGQSEAKATAPSLTAWLEQFAAAIEKGEYVEDPERGGFRRRGP